MVLVAQQQFRLSGLTRPNKRSPASKLTHAMSSSAGGGGGGVGAGVGVASATEVLAGIDSLDGSSTHGVGGSRASSRASSSTTRVRMSSTTKHQQSSDAMTALAGRLSGIGGDEVAAMATLGIAQPPTPTLTTGGASSTLREQDEVVQRLQKHNFNLMLRIYYLEERLAQARGETGVGQSEAQLQEQIMEYKVHDRTTSVLEARLTHAHTDSCSASPGARGGTYAGGGGA